MSPDQATSAATAHATPTGADAQQAQQAQLVRLALLFRGASREGRIHPLQHLIQRHWADKAQQQGGGR